MTAPRIVVPGATTAITRRTTYRKAFLAPWDPLVDELWLYALGYAQEQTGVEVHHTKRVLTHHHTNVTPVEPNLPEFLRLVHRDVSCALNALLEDSGYEAPGEIFDKRSTHAMRLIDAEAQAAHLIYEELNCVAAGLVERPEDMPGRVIDFGVWKTGGIEIPRPPIYFGPDRPEVVTLRLTPPPVLYGAFDGDIDRLVYHLRRLSEECRRALRSQRTRPVLGPETLKQLHPWSEARSVRERSRGPVPTFRIGGLAASAERQQVRKEERSWRGRYRETWQRRREGDPDATFPYGTYEMRALHGAPTDPSAPEDAVLSAPGPLLGDVQAAIDGGEGRGGDRALSRSVVRNVRESFVEQAAQIVAAEELSPEALGCEDQGADAGTGGVAVRHRREPIRRFFATGARRMVVLRDNGRGRPPRGGGPHGADPPG